MVAVLGEPPSPDGIELGTLAAGADALEVRADLVGDLDPHWLRQHFSGTLIYALRSAEEGGRFSGGLAQRHARLRAAARAYDQVELEWARDLTPELLAAVPAGRRRLSRHVAQSADLETLTRLVGQMTEIPAALYIVSTAADSAEDAVAVIALLVAAKRSDLTAFATGAGGLWTRILAPHLGAPVAFGQIGTDGQAGAPTLAQLQADYGLPELVPVRCLYGILVRGARRSASPRLHNRAHRMLGLPAINLPFVIEDLDRFWRVMLPALDAADLPLRGLTVVAPFKERAMDLVARATEIAVRCGAANLVWREGDTWMADSTVGVVPALIARGFDPSGQRAAVVGCGGHGRVIAAALAIAGAEVCLVNRSSEGGRAAARLLNLPFVPLAEFSPEGFALLVHATPVVDRLLFPLAGLSRDVTVVELMYKDTPTPLMREARARGLSTMDGWQVLAAEIAMQFKGMTGQTMPPSAADDRPASPSAVDRPLLEETK